MRIKFLSIIASFFMVSLLITSCLDDDNTVEYGTDATIHAFELDTIGGYGVSYKFTIDQLKGLIYNEDSLPVRADTIIDRILIKTLSTSSGIVTMKSKDNQDSIINLNDSIDLSKYINPNASDKYLKLTVWAPDMINKKEYSLGLRVHKHDPDSLNWEYMSTTTIPNNAPHKSVLLKNTIKTYVVENGILNVFTITTDKSASSSPATVSGHLFNNQLPTSILEYKDVLYATSDTKDGKVYQSTDGITWNESTPLFGNDHVDMLLAPLNDKITYIKTDNGIQYFSSTSNITFSARAEAELQKVPADFPTKNFSYTAYSTQTNVAAVMLVGDYEEGKQPTVGDGDDKQETVVPWGYMGDEWVSFPPNNVTTSCPAIKHPSIIYYNSKYYIFGEDFNSFYTAEAIYAWKKANKKFSFPYFTGWGNSPAPSYDVKETPEFRGRKVYSTVLDPKTARIWIVFSGGTATFKDTVVKTGVRATTEEERTYTYPSEIWQGRLNQLWFDIANGKYTY